MSDRARIDGPAQWSGGNAAFVVGTIAVPVPLRFCAPGSTGRELGSVRHEPYRSASRTTEHTAQSTTGVDDLEHYPSIPHAGQRFADDLPVQIG